MKLTKIIPVAWARWGPRVLLCLLACLILAGCTVAVETEPSVQATRITFAPSVDVASRLYTVTMPTSNQGE